MTRKNYQIERLPGEPIILAVNYEEFSIAEDQQPADAETRMMLDQATEPLYLIIDLTRQTMRLDDIILGANIGAGGQAPLWQHPNVQEVIFVTTKAIVKLAIQGLDSLPFGNTQAKAFETQEEALAYARTRIAEV